MQIEQRYCIHHPDRAAIGICVVTRQPICAECSTRYDGVNYSKEGLQILQEQRRAQEKGRGRGWARGVLVGLVPVMLLLIYGFYLVLVGAIMAAIHGE
jgi:hypothetical protein